MQVSDATSQRTPGQGATGVTFLGSIHPKVANVVDGAFGTQHVAEDRERLVVQLHRVTVEAMLDANPFLTLVKITDDLTAEVGGDGAAERQASTKEAHDVGAAEGADGVLQQTWVQPAEVVSGVEGEVDRPLALEGGPVIRGRMGFEQLLVHRV